MGMRQAIQLSECISRHQNNGHDHAQASTTKVSTARQSTRRKGGIAFMGQLLGWSRQIVTGGWPIQECQKFVLKKPKNGGRKTGAAKRGQVHFLSA
jgi:hypothetical protein